MRQGRISTMLMKQCLNTIADLQKKKIKHLPPEPEVSDCYHPSETQKNGELLFVAVGTDIGTYALDK